MLRYLGPAALAGIVLAVSVAGWSADSPSINIDNFTFSPKALTVAKGTEVTWTNRDDIPHSIVLTALGARSKALDSDASFTYRFDKAGTFSYMCGLHPAMKGQIVVN